MSFVTTITLWRLLLILSLTVQFKVNGQELECPKPKRWIPVFSCFQPQDNETRRYYEQCDRQRNQTDECILEAMDKAHQNVIGFILSQDWRHIHVHEPAYVETPLGSSIVCLIPKVGSTPWKRVALRQVEGTMSRILFSQFYDVFNASIFLINSKRAKFSTDSDHLYSDWFKHVPRINVVRTTYPSKALQVLSDPKIPRWVIVRNPYSRVYSVYKNKYVETKGSLNLFHKLLNLKVKKNETTNFKEFVKGLYDTYYDPVTKTRRSLQSFKTNDKVDYHLALWTSLCGIQQGFEYDYVLKHELIADWYPRIIKILNFTDVVMQGWPGDDECFLSTPEMPCNGPSAEVITQGLSSNSTSKYMHSHNSNAHMIEEYDAQTAAMVTEMFYEDFFSFSYPTWDGRPESFRLTF